MRRVDVAMRHVVGDAVTQDLQDPRVGFVTVTDVKTSADLRHARVYVSILGTPAEQEASLEGLRSAHGYLQRRVASERLNVECGVRGCASDRGHGEGDYRVADAERAFVTEHLRAQARGLRGAEQDPERAQAALPRFLD